jgi:hypothetical protein
MEKERKKERKNHSKSKFPLCSLSVSSSGEKRKMTSQLRRMKRLLRNPTCRNEGGEDEKESTSTRLTVHCCFAGLLIAHMALRYPMTPLTT